VSLERAKDLGMLSKSSKGISVGLAKVRPHDRNPPSTADEKNKGYFYDAVYYSLRLQQRTTFSNTKTLLVFFQGTVPRGAGAWPALWLLGNANAVDASTSWPSQGELDLLEFHDADGEELFADTVIHACPNVSVRYRSALRDKDVQSISAKDPGNPRGDPGKVECDPFVWSNGCGMGRRLDSQQRSPEGSFAYIWNPTDKTLTAYYSSTTNVIAKGQFPALVGTKRVHFTDSRGTTHKLSAVATLSYKCDTRNPTGIDVPSSRAPYDQDPTLNYPEHTYLPTVSTFSRTGGPNAGFNCKGSFKKDCSSNFGDMGLVLNTSVCGDIYIDKGKMRSDGGICMAQVILNEKNTDTRLSKTASWRIKALLARNI
jgi:hypothetical protein